MRRLARGMRIVLAVLLVQMAAGAQSWQGHWETSLGKMRLYPVGQYVVGDFGDKGVVLAEKQFDLLRGVFTDPTRRRSGTFLMKMTGERHFAGSYSFAKGTKVDWNGRRTSNAWPRLSNFSGRERAATDDQSHLVDGFYKSSYGDLKLRSGNGFLFGDYGTKGILVGQWMGDHYLGQFTNNGKLGWFRFHFQPQTGAFVAGQWGWVGSSQRDGRWTLQKQRAGQPRLTQVAPPDNSNQVAIEPSRVDSGPTPAPPQNNNANPRPAGAYPYFLSPTRGFNKERGRTLMTMQHHIQWVSKENEGEVLNALGKADYQVVGNRLITSEVNDSTLSRMFTTPRLRCYVATKGDDVVVCFRGSKAVGHGWQTLVNAGTDVAGNPARFGFFYPASRASEADRKARVHGGFNRAYGRLRQRIITSLRQHQGKNLYIFGHSLGGAQATLCALDVGVNMPRGFKSLTLITSGAPRVGGATFKQALDRAVPNAFRIEVVNDPIPMVPPQKAPLLVTERYEHVGDLLMLRTDGSAVSPLNVEKRPSSARPKFHSNETYFDTVKKFFYRAGRAGYYDDKGRLPQRCGIAERRL